MNDADAAGEQEIIRQCLSGNRDQYAVLVDRYRDMACNIAWRMVGDGDIALDMAQESFIAAFSGLRGFRHGSRFSSWLFRIVINKCRDHLRSRRETVPADVLLAETGREPTPEQAMCARQTSDAVQMALNRLPVEYREVIVLKHIEELGYGEIAEILGDSVNALKVRAHRGRVMLRHLLEGAGINA